MRYTFGQINEQTGFANGDKFANEQEVRDYFTPDAQIGCFADDAITDEEVLIDMANQVIANGWHMETADAVA